MILVVSEGMVEERDRGWILEWDLDCLSVCGSAAVRGQWETDGARGTVSIGARSPRMSDLDVSVALAKSKTAAETVQVTEHVLGLRRQEGPTDLEGSCLVSRLGIRDEIGMVLQGRFKGNNRRKREPKGRLTRNRICQTATCPSDIVQSRYTLGNLDRTIEASSRR